MESTLKPRVCVCVRERGGGRGEEGREGGREGGRERVGPGRLSLSL